MISELEGWSSSFSVVGRVSMIVLTLDEMESNSLIDSILTF